MAVKFFRNVGLHAAVVLFIHLTCCYGIKKDPRSQFYGHAVVHPSIYTEAREKRDLNSVNNTDKLTVSFVAFEKQFVINLKMNKKLMPKHYFEKHHENGSYVTHLPMKNDESHCHYQGHIQGMDHSWAAISTCNGISGVVYDGNELHYIQPEDNNEDGKHLVFRSSDLVPQNFTCGYSSNKDNLVMPDILKILNRKKRSINVREPYKSNAKSRYVEIIIVNDHKEFQELNGDKKAVFERSKMIANIVNGLYSPLNVFIALVGIIVWTDYDEIKMSADGDVTLDNFLHYRRERLALEHPNDSAQLITAMTFDGGVVGKSLKSVACTYQYSGGVNMDHSHVVGLVATTVSHELGHSFGMEHDTEECQCPDDKCIMAPSSSSVSPRHWSSCSVEYLELAFSSGMDYCLRNRPTEIVGPVCGNGFLEDGEDCDCGLKDFCDNHCCNASTCLFYENATCATGQCCDIKTCQVKKVATLCREPVGECDFPEYCDGNSEFCPADTFHQNGIPCGNDKAYCYNGNCRSHEDQCKVLWGQTGKMSDFRCYEQNYRGNVNGNCGYNRVNQTYKPCRKEDILCGMLHCSHLNEKLEFGMEPAAILAHSFINVKGKVFTCRSAIVDLGLFNTDPGLVPDGAQCGDSKTCVNQKCVPVSTLQKPACPYSCSGNGICNNNGNCHCFDGFAPPYCDSPGAGGSIDSGPASDPGRSIIVMAMYVLFLGLLPLIVLSAVAMYYYRNHLKMWWSKKTHKAQIKSRTKTTTQRKAQPPSKFNFDHNILRTLEISAPIQIPLPAVAPENHPSNFSSQPPKNTNNFCQVHISPPVLQASSHNTDSSNFVPVRPAPPKPVNAPKRTPSWNPTTAVVAPTVLRTASLKSPTGNRPLSASTFRPSVPPPRPPPPKSNSPFHQPTRQQEELGKFNEVQRSETPSTYYDDCQTLDFSDTPLAFVHTPGKKKVATHKPEVSYSKHGGSFSSIRNSAVIERKGNPGGNKQNENIAKVLPHIPRTSENSVVASLAQKFEKSDKSKTDNSSNVSLRPPFKSRPLPPRPDDPQV